MTELAHDYLTSTACSRPRSWELRDGCRGFVQERIKPNIAGWYNGGTSRASWSRSWARCACSACT